MSLFWTREWGQDLHYPKWEVAARLSLHQRTIPIYLGKLYLHNDQTTSYIKNKKHIIVPRTDQRFGPRGSWDPRAESEWVWPTCKFLFSRSGGQRWEIGSENRALHCWIAQGGKEEGSEREKERGKREGQSGKERGRGKGFGPLSRHA